MVETDHCRRPLHHPTVSVSSHYLTAFDTASHEPDTITQHNYKGRIVNKLSDGAILLSLFNYILLRNRTQSTT